MVPSMNVVVVESPAKAKTINKYLGSDFQVLASYGHVRDLPAKDGSVRPDEDFAMSWTVDSKAEKRLADIVKALKGGATRLILATDPDREGEAISWHVLEFLRGKKVLNGVDVVRVAFNAITKAAVLEAMSHPRQIDAALVDAYLARRALDYLVGFTLSPVLWRKLPGARSAGRVQSVALRLVCDREGEIERFVAQEYWDIGADLTTPRGDGFTARLVSADGKKLQRLDIKNEAQALALKEQLQRALFAIDSVEAKPVKRHPAPPFTTSTLQQEASRKLGLSPQRSMQIAQRLYEGVETGGETIGLITYMRTDGVQMAGEAVAQARSVIGRLYGDSYVPSVPRAYSAKAKNAQEAHEAIRPTDLSRLPREVMKSLPPEEAKLYELIWTRALASQMDSALLERTTATITASAAGSVFELRAVGSVVKFDGFLKLYQEGRDDEDDEENKRLPVMTAGETAKLVIIDAKQHFTEPPPRFTEASLVKRMEELGIGRPSTYASTLNVLRERSYVRIEKKRLHAEDKGRLVTVFLQNFFNKYVEFDFTADLEEQLDRISSGDIDWRQVLRAFWDDFSATVDATKNLRIGEVISALDQALGPHIFPTREDGSDARSCPTCGNGQLSLKLGKFGAFIGCSNYPNCRFTRPLMAPDAEKGGAIGGDGETPGVKTLGVDPDSGQAITIRDGRFGAYVQLGEGEKPKRASIPKAYNPAMLELPIALKLLSLPRQVGTHPESGEAIIANLGRYGPYIQHGKTYANLSSVDEVFDVGLNRAVTLLAEKIAKGPGRVQRAPGKVLGIHPTLGQDIVLHDGRYGAYVAHDGVNATLPRGVEKDDFTLAAAAVLIDAKRAAGGGKPAKSARSTPKAPAKSTAAKKPAKTATKKTKAKAVDGA